MWTICHPTPHVAWGDAVLGSPAVGTREKSARETPRAGNVRRRAVFRALAHGLCGLLLADGARATSERCL